MHFCKDIPLILSNTRNSSRLYIEQILDFFHIDFDHRPFKMYPVVKTGITNDHKYARDSGNDSLCCEFVSIA